MSAAPTLAQSFLEEVKHASSVLIGTHLNPDGDALGSALALAHYLDQLGVECDVLCHHAAPRNLLFLPGVGRIRQHPRHEKYDLGIVLDLDSTDRLGDTETYFSRCPRTVVIDHHVPHQAPGDLRIVDTAAPATAVILTRVLLELGAKITPEIATCLLTGIVTDTGSFRFRNTTPEALHLAAALIERGANLGLITEEVFQCKPLGAARLLGRALEGMRLACGDRLAWTVLTARDFDAAGARDEDTEGFVNEILSLASVEIAAILREPKDGKVRCSLRSKAAYDVAEVARAFGGGGHRNAAGCTFDLPLEEAEAKIVERLKACLGFS